MTATVDTPPKVEPSLRKSPRRIPFAQEAGLIIVVGLLYLFFTLDSRGLPSRYWNPFLNLDNQANGILAKMSMYGIMAVGMTGVIITGGIDISVGAIFAIAGLSGGLALQMLGPDAGWMPTLAVGFLVPLAVGGLCGLLNGAITTLLQLHPFIVTLATMSILRGLCTRVFPPTVPQADHPLPTVFSDIMRHKFGPDGLVLIPGIVMLFVVILGAIFLQTTIAGRETYAYGGNLEAARYSGIRVWWVNMRVYILMGLCCGIAATVNMGRFGTAEASAADAGYELNVIASAVVGGAALTGGRGTALGALLGTLVISAIENGINTMQWNTSYTKIIVGASIILAVSVDRLSNALFKSRRRLQK